MIYEVFFPFGEYTWDAKNRRKKTTNGLLEIYAGISDSLGWFNALAPSDDFGRWLIDNCPSWVYFSEDRGSWQSIFSKEIVGAVLGFRDPGDAILVKLTWGGR